MKIAEVREKAKSFEKDVLVEMLATAYRMVPKARREEELDPLILAGDPKLFARKKASAPTPEDFETLKGKINFFTENAYEGNYASPNRIIPKQKRSKWRFEVKAFYKALTVIPDDDPHAPEAAKLLQSLYDTLSRGCGYWLFTTDDPFRSVGIAQTDFFRAVCEKTLHQGIRKELLSSLLNSLTRGYPDRETLTISIYAELAAALKSADAKYLAIEAASEIIKKTHQEMTAENNRKKGSRYSAWSTALYEKKETIKELCEFVEILSLYLQEPEDGARFYWQYQAEDNKEIALYILLDVVSMFAEDDREWIRVYEDAINRLKIKPREYLQSKYRKKKSGQHEEA